MLAKRVGAWLRGISAAAAEEAPPTLVDCPGAGAGPRASAASDDAAWRAARETRRALGGRGPVVHAVTAPQLHADTRDAEEEGRKS